MGSSMSKSLAPECTPAKQAYDDCFKEWYEKFLRGESSTNECEEKFTVYQTCVKTALVRQGIIKNLDEARQDAPFEQGGRPNSE